MRNKQAIEQAIKDVFTKYQETFGGDGFADADINQLIKRTVARKRVEFLDEAMDVLNLSQAELDGYDKELEQDSSERAEKLFEGYLAEGDLKMAEYQVNNYRKLWSVEKRSEMAKRINPDFVICPHENLVVSSEQARITDKVMKKAEEKRLRKEAKKQAV